MAPRTTDKRGSGHSGRSGSNSPTASRSESNSSSKASSPAESINFRFLNFASPSDQRNAQIRRDIRSHVTSRQHRIQRRVLAEQAQADRVSPFETSSPSHADAATSEIEASSADEASPPHSPGDASPSPPVPLRRINIAELYPTEWHPYLRPIMDHYMTNMAIDVPNNDAALRVLLGAHFMPVVLSDPAPLHALMLTAAAHYSKLQGPQSHNINLLQLKGMAIQEINRALTDHRSGGRSISDQLIIAVAKMATFELLFGHQETFHTHMTGLQRMVSLRGGLPALGCNGMLERSLLWLDANAAHIRGVLYFPPGSYSSTSGHPPADQTVFVWGSQAPSP